MNEYRAGGRLLYRDCKKEPRNSEAGKKVTVGGWGSIRPLEQLDKHAENNQAEEACVRHEAHNEKRIDILVPIPTGVVAASMPKPSKLARNTSPSIHPWHSEKERLQNNLSPMPREDILRNFWYIC